MATYIKPSSVKSILPPATNTGVDINTQVGNVKKQYGDMSTEQLYGAMLNVKPPAQQDILQQVGTQYGYNDRIAGLRQQAGEIQRKMLSDQSALFAATNPDGTPVDPRVKVAQFQENMTRDSQRLQQIQKIQDVYSAEMQTLATAIADQYKAKAQDTQTAIQFMQQLNQEKNSDRSYDLQRDQFEWQKSQAGRPNYVFENGTWVDKNSSVSPGMQGPVGDVNVGGGRTQNRPDRNNNPGNVKLIPGYDVSKIPGAVGVDDQNHLRFATPQDGYNWMLRDVSAKLSGNTRTGLTPDSTLADLGKVYAEDPGWGSSVSRISGYSLGTKLKDIDVNRLAPAIAKQEGFSGDIKAVNNTVSEDTEITSADIALFNSPKYNPQTDKNQARAKKYEIFQNKSAEIMSDPNIDILEKMKFSQGSKSLTESPSKAYKDMGLVVSQLSNLKGAIDEYNDSTWFGSGMNPIQSIIASKNPWNTKAQEVKSRLQAIVPKIARGIFGEVGVLTDQDIANYMQTLPNIKQTADVQDVVQLALLETLKSGLDNNISVDSATYDTSGLIGNYKILTKKIEELQKKVVDDAPQQNASIPGLPPGRFQSQTGTGVGRWQQSNQ